MELTTWNGPPLSTTLDPTLDSETPEFLIEFDDTQDNGNHIHSVWRDYKNDWGEDLLAAHYKTSH